MIEDKILGNQEVTSVFVTLEILGILQVDQNRVFFDKTLFQNMAIGLAIGIGAGLALGSGLDAQDRAARKRANAPKKLDTPTEEKKAK